MSTPVYLRLEEACRKYNLEHDLLMRAVEHGVVRAIRVNGHIAVAEEDVRKLRDANGEPVTDLPRYIPLTEAAERYGVSEEVLERAIESGTIRAVQLDQEVAVAEGDVREIASRQELWQQVQYLDGVPITIEKACRKYGLSKPSLYRWIRQGFVRVLYDQRGGKRGGRGNKRLLNEADVAYAALVADVRKVKRGQRTFTREYWPPHMLG